MSRCPESLHHTPTTPSHAERSPPATGPELKTVQHTTQHTRTGVSARPAREPLSPPPVRRPRTPGCATRGQIGRRAAPCTGEGHVSLWCHSRALTRDSKPYSTQRQHTRTGVSARRPRAAQPAALGFGTVLARELVSFGEGAMPNAPMPRRSWRRFDSSARKQITVWTHRSRQRPEAAAALHVPRGELARVDRGARVRRGPLQHTRRRGKNRAPES